MSTDGRAHDELSNPHLLQFDEITLLGGGRTIHFQPGLNFIKGDITTGKTTAVRLLRASVGAVPKVLPPETGYVRAIQGKLQLGEGRWNIYRPLVTTREARVEIANSAGEADSRPASGPGGYGSFLLGALEIPEAYVPRARKEPTAELTPISINDWLAYCIVTGDALDYEVFGHKDAFRDIKRRWVFELIYGLYDVEIAELVAAQRRLELRITSLESEAEIIDKFVVDTPFASRDDLVRFKSDRERERANLLEAGVRLRDEALPAEEVGRLREQVLSLRDGIELLREQSRDVDGNLQDLRQLREQLATQSTRLTRAIVSEEWLVDFDFVVCPRCGTGVARSRARAPHCYLCLQDESQAAVSTDSLIAEQERVLSQIVETDEVIVVREVELASIRAQILTDNEGLRRASETLDLRTRGFVSEQASRLAETAQEIARAESDISWANRCLSVFAGQESRERKLAQLKSERDDIAAEIESRESVHAVADEHIEALERRFVEYLERLHIPLVGEMLSARINRTTYLPEVSGRTFDELSSQGLKTLVNIAHALAHHTVAIDRDLPLPGLLVLDGVSANSGREGFDGDRVQDAYRLFLDVASQYGTALQLIVSDNDLPQFITTGHEDRIALNLSQDDRLIRIPTSEISDAASGEDSPTE